MKHTDKCVFSVSFEDHSFPLETTYVINEIFDGGIYLDDHPERRALVNRFAQSEDYRLRKLAAQSEGLTTENAVKLAQDPCFSVRDYISTNSDATARLNAAQLYALGQTDHAIAGQLISSPCTATAQMHKELTVNLLMHYAKEGEVQLADVVDHLKCNLQDSENWHKDTVEIVDVDTPLDFKRRGTGKAKLHYEDLSFELTSDEVLNLIIFHLGENPAFRSCAYFLVYYPDVAVVDYVAEQLVEDVKLLKRMLLSGSHRIGMAALRNKIAWKLSYSALRSFLKEDADAIEEVLGDEVGELQLKVARAYRDSASADIRAVVARFDAKYQSDHHKDPDDFKETRFAGDEIDVLPMPPNGFDAAYFGLEQDDEEDDLEDEEDGLDDIDDDDDEDNDAREDKNEAEKTSSQKPEVKGNALHFVLHNATVK